MIQLKNILLVQSIAQAIKDDGCFVTPSVGPIIRGLNSESFFGFEYDESTLTKTLPIVTKEDTNHTEMLENAAEVIAANLRERFENVRTIISPLVNRIEERVREETHMSAPIDNMMQGLYLNLHSVDTIPFDSKYLPTEVSRKIDYNKGDIKKYLSGTYLYLEDEQAISLMNTSDEEINTLFAENCRGVRNIFNEIFHDKEDGFADMPLRQFTACYGFWLLLNKLIRADEPIPQATKVTLDDYKADLAYVRDLAQAWLVESRNKLIFYRNAKVIITNNKAKLNTGNVVPTITGNVEVWYTDEAVEQILAQDCTLTEMIYGYLIGSLMRRIPTGFDPVMVKEYSALYRQVNEEMVDANGVAFAKNYLKIAIEVIERYVADNPVLLSAVNEKYEKANMGECVEFKRITRLLSHQIEDLEKKLRMRSDEENFDSRNILMESPLLLDFMRVIGLTKSADLICNTLRRVSSAEMDTQAKIRENNTKVVIRTIVGELLRGN